MNFPITALIIHVLGWVALIAMLWYQQKVILRQAVLLRNARQICDALLQEAQRLGRRVEELNRTIKDQDEGDWWKRE